MSETQNNPEYLQHHPNAVANTEKAHIMAKAADYDEATAAGLRQITYSALENNPNAEEGFDDALRTVLDGGALEADPQLQKLYPRVLDQLPNSNLQVNEVAQAIKESQTLADKTYKFVDKSYDKLKATER